MYNVKHELTDGTYTPDFKVQYPQIKIEAWDKPRLRDGDNLMVFVFGSNAQGHHGAGAALYAVKHCGAVSGQGHGRRGNSYALATRVVKPGNPYIVDLPFEEVQKNVAAFLDYARQYPELEFQVTAIGTGHAGFTHAQIAPLFADCPDNCFFDTVWATWLPDKKFWGTY